MQASKDLRIFLWGDFVRRISLMWTSGSSFAVCARCCRRGEEEGQAGWAQHKKATFPFIHIVNTLGNPVLAMRNGHDEAQRINTLYIFLAYLFIVPFEEFRTSTYAAVQCTGEENCTCRCLDSTAGNNLIFCFFLGHLKILSYCAYLLSISAFNSAPSIFSFSSSNSAPFCRISFLLVRISSALAYSALIIVFISSSMTSAVVLL